MRTKVRAALDAIEDVLLKQDQDAQDLACILSALRGPDAENEQAQKIETTCSLRSIAFPRLYQSRVEAYGSYHSFFEISPSRGWSMSPARSFDPLPASSQLSHFEEHITMAAHAINRKENE